MVNCNLIGRWLCNRMKLDVIWIYFVACGACKLVNNLKGFFFSFDYYGNYWQLKLPFVCCESDGSDIFQSSPLLISAIIYITI